MVLVPRTMLARMKAGGTGKQTILAAAGREAVHFHMRKRRLPLFDWVSLVRQLPASC